MRGRDKCIYSSSGIDFLATLEEWPLLRVATKRGTTVLSCLFFFQKDQFSNEVHMLDFDTLTWFLVPAQVSRWKIHRLSRLLPIGDRGPVI